MVTLFSPSARDRAPVVVRNKVFLSRSNLEDGLANDSDWKLLFSKSFHSLLSDILSPEDLRNDIVGDVLWKMKQSIQLLDWLVIAIRRRLLNTVLH
jgi:hypothetical protein